MSIVTPLPFHPTKIMLPTDFSPSAGVALQTAADLALHFGAELYVLHALPMFPVAMGMEYPSNFYPQQEFLEEAKRGAESRLLEGMSPLIAKGVRTRSSIEVGDDVAGSIMTAIKRESSDLLILSTHGLSGWRPVVFGSIAEKVVKQVQCPLLLLRSIKAG